MPVFSCPVNGVVSIDAGTSNQNAYSVTVQADGRILLGGYSLIGGGNSDFTLLRFNSNGSPDSTFGDDGIVTTDLGNDAGYSVSVQTDGKILMGGSSSLDFALVRYNTDGSLDTAFSGDGKVTTDLGAEDEGRFVIVQTNGKILVGGSSNSGYSDFALVRYNSDGTLDTSFSGDGKVITSFGGSDYGYSVAVQTNGKILVGGKSNNGVTNFALARYNSDGSLDSSFSGDGKVVTDFGDDASGYSVTLQTDGKILMGGTYDIYNFGKFALARYNTDGSLDTTFDGDGKVINALNFQNGFSVTLQTDGKILLVGSGSLARYNSNGSLDTSFDGDGLVVTSSAINGYFYGNSVAVQTDGKILVGGVVNNGGYSNFSLIRYNSDGSLDASFNGNYSPIGTVIINDTTPEKYQTLTVSNTIADANGLGVITYTWLANGIIIGTGSSYAVTGSDVGKSISVTASYTDGLGKAETVSSAGTGLVTLAKLTLNGTTADDLLNGGEGNDILNGGTGNDLLDGDAGNDMISGGDGSDFLHGDAGNDKLIGGNGNDLLNGGEGYDTLNGAAGNDVLTGGMGKDTFLFNTSLLLNVDKITDFKPVDDTIQLENSIFTKLTTTGVLNAANFVIATAADNNDYLVYNKTAGALFYDADGNGAGAAVKVAALGVNLTLTNADFVVI